MRRIVGLAALFTLVACTRDMSLPPPPTPPAPPAPGTVYGRVVYSQPGRTEKVPARGATLTMLGTSLAVTTTDAEGRFLVEGITASTGQLLVRFDAGATGQPTHQVLLELGSFGVGLGHQISLGDVLVTQNAQLHGIVRRGDVAGVGGHGGTVVYVPEGPYTTYTGDDGSFELTQLPAGTLSLAFFRIGYQTVTLDGLTLRAGEDFALRDELLSPDAGGSATPATLTGHVSFSPETAATGTSAVAVDGLGETRAGTVTTAGDFTIRDVPPGLYQVIVSHPGYTSARLPNVLVAPGQKLALPALVLEKAAATTTTACVAGAACQPANLCRAGSVSCSTGGAATCVEAGTALDGTACGSGLVCQAGACVPFCVGGGTCSPSNACHIGVTVCTAEGPVCSDTGASLPNGAPCAPGQVCSGGACIPCTGASCGVCSTVCVPANPCHLGSQVCGTAASTCTDLGTPSADGTGCGTNQVCLAGACVPCAAGVLCQPTNPCKTGITACAAGVSACAETGNLADGTACGGANSCRAGACSPPETTMGTLARNASPTSTETLYLPAGVAVATNGDVYFTDRYHHQVKRVPAAGGAPVVVAGTGACGSAGDSGPATAAQLCYPSGLALDESGGGTLYVSDTSNDVVRAIQLGGSKLIFTYAGGGAATAAPWGDGPIATDATFQLPTRLALAWDGATPPVRWLYVADTGHGRIRRVHTGTGAISTWLAASSACDGGEVLSACGADPAGCSVAFDARGNGFVSGLVCGGAFGTTGRYGVVRVSPGGALAAVAGSAQRSFAEGVSALLAFFDAPPALALDAAGNLFTTDGAANRVRRIDGASGRIDTIVNGTGTAGTTGDGGPGIDATIDAPWDAAFDPVTRTDLVLTEAGGNVVRIARGAGSPVLPQAALSVLSGADQTAPVDEPAPIALAVQLVDGAGTPLAGYRVTFSSLTSGGSLSTTAPVTDAAGVAAVTARPGLAAQTYRFQASFLDLHGAHVPGSPATFTVRATPFAAGTIQAVVNAPRVAGNGTSGPGVLAAVSLPAGLATAADGTLYFSDHGNHMVKALAPDGTVSVIAGTGACAATGDGQRAVDAALCSPRGLALDAPARKLYVADAGNARVRVVDLAAGTIDRFAGGGSAPAPDYGNGGLATAASLATLSHLSLHDVGGVHYLYITDIGRGHVRRVQIGGGAGAGVIGPAFAPTGSCTGTVGWYSCGYDPGCDLAWDAAGNAFVSGVFCGTDFGSSYANGVARIAPDGTMSQVAGAYGGTADEGVPAEAALFTYPPALALDAAGNLYAADWGGDRVRRLDAATHRIDTLAGDGTPSSTGDGGPATAATLWSPWALAFDVASGTTLYVSEYSGLAIRVLPGAGTAAASVAALAAVGATSQTSGVGQQGAAITVRLTGAGGAALPGRRVTFTSLTPGGSISPAVALTDAGGVAAATPRAGQAPQAYLFRASFDDLHGRPVSGSPVSFTLNATAPAVGTISALVDADRTAGNSGVGGPASIARIAGPVGVAVARDGTVFFSDARNHQVKAIAPNGLLSLVAGDGSARYAGDGGLAVDASLYTPKGLALDEGAARLYVADSGNVRVRVVDLATGRISTFAGGGTAGAPGYGDGTAAVSATLSDPNQVVLWKDPASQARLLYVVDGGHGRIRRVDVNGPTAGIIDAFLTPTASCAGTIGWYSCGSEPGCSLVFDGPGTGFVSGTFCGSDFGASYTYGVARFDGTGLVAPVAGFYSGTSSEGVSARAASFSYPPSLALDAAGNLFTADWSGNRIRRIDGATGRIDTVVGTGVTGSGGDGGPALSANLANPYLITFDPATLATLYLSDYSGNSVRMVRGAGRVVPSTATLTLAGGGAQSVLVDQLAPVPFSVSLADGAGTLLPGYRVEFAAVTPGGSVTATEALTSGAGVALTSVRVGQRPVTHRFVARFDDIHGRPVTGSPVALDVAAAAPAAGTAFVAVDVDRTAGNTGAGGPGTLAHVNTPSGAVMAADGTLFFSDRANHQVKALSPAGVLTVVAGSGGCGLTGDGGAAVAAALCSPTGLALDETTPPGLLYVGDTSNHRVRAVDLATGLISTVAGGGTATAAPWGDGGAATAGVLASPTHVRFRLGKLWIADTGHNLVRVVDAAGNLSTFLAPSTASCPTAGTLATDVIFYSCQGEQGCDVAWDGSGNSYISGYFCGGVQMGAYYFYGIVRTTDGVTLEHVAGRYNTPPAADGAKANATPVAGPPSLFFGADGRLYYVVTAEHAVRAIDHLPDLSLATVATVAGAVPAPTTTPGDGADYVPATSLRLRSPWDYAQPAKGGHGAVCDTGNDAVRLIW